jgi:3-hydroxyisobutyrate dehydrogenase-like beta-hydroxyacid dehydrogenase
MNMTDVTLIGLGQMGVALADLMLRAGKSVSLWNRSPNKAAALVARGAILAETPAAAIAASPVTLICVYDYDAARDILVNRRAIGTPDRRAKSTPISILLFVPQRSPSFRPGPCMR